MLALVHYRGGRHAEAIRRAEAALKAEIPDDPWQGTRVVSALVLALAHHRLGQAGEAEAWLDRAICWMKGCAEKPRADARGACHWWANRMESEFLRREAELSSEQKKKRRERSHLKQTSTVELQ